MIREEENVIHLGEKKKMVMKEIGRIWNIIEEIKEIKEKLKDYLEDSDLEWGNLERVE